MKTKKIVLAALAGTALLAASAAQAYDNNDRGHGYRNHGHYHRHVPPPRYVVRPAPVYYAPAPVYVAPQPVYYAPPPVYYAPPRPVIFGSLPLGDARVRIGVQF